MKPTVTAIIPIYRLSGPRLRNFLFILERMKAAGMHEILVVEQVASAEQITSVSAIKSIPKLIQVVVKDERFCKARLLNQGLLAATGEYVWFNDADVYVPFRKILDRLNGEIVLKPFRDAWLLNDDQTDQFISSKHVQLEEAHIEKLSVFGGGSLLVRRDRAMEVGGYDEAFAGWGYEDAEFGSRVTTINDQDTFWDINAIHLYHDRDIDAIREDAPENRTRCHDSRTMCQNNLEERVTTLKTSVPVSAGTSPVFKVFPPEAQDDFAMVMCTYGDSPLRVASVTSVFTELAKQVWMPPVYFTELRYDDSPSPYAQFQRYPWFKHVIVRGSELHRDIFQKECLNNYGARSMTARYVGFMDTDCYSDDHYWFWKIYQQVSSAPDTVCQTYMQYNDTVESEQTRISYAYLWQQGEHNLTRGQGMGWAMSMDFFHRMNGFNPWYVTGGGDAAFCIEHMEDHRHSDTILRQRWWRESLRPDQPKAKKIECVKVKVLHVYHGPFKERAYYYRRAGVEGVGGPQEYLELDDKGLFVWKPRWRGTKNPMQYVLQNKSQLSTVEACKQVIEEAWADVPAEERERIMTNHLGPAWRDAMDQVSRGFTSAYKMDECKFRFTPPAVEKVE
jgi:hypothetical protein